MNNNVIVELIDLKRVFKTGDSVINALDGISLKIKRGEFLLILGASGSGKTTLLNQIGGIDKPTSGRVIVDGIEINKLSDRKLTEYRGKKIGWVFQFFNLIPSLTAMENVGLALELAGDTENMDKRSKELLSIVGLADFVNRYPSQLSGGQQQRVALCRALVKNPALVVADEPTGNLDSKTGHEVVEVMKKLNQEKGMTFIVVSHDSRLKEVADRVLYLEDGKIINEELEG